ncbi:MAG: glycosyl transferase [Chloroflexi bacterium]|nr:glycosyl transferase [Chloroflexota bacterium]
MSIVCARAATANRQTGKVRPAPTSARSVPRMPLPRVSVVIPTLNEADNLPHVLPRIPQWIHEVVVVDGNSTDGTPEVARALWPNIHIVTQEGQGKGAALRSGFAVATGEIMIMLDADGSMDPAEIPMFVGALLSGAEFVKGSRFLQGGGTADMPCYRRWGNRAFVQLVRFLFGGHFSDLCYGYNAFWSWAVPLLQLNAIGFEIEAMMNVRALQAGLKIVEVPSFEAKRVYGIGRLQTIPDGWRVLKTIWSEWMSPVPRQAALGIKQWATDAGIAGDSFEFWSGGRALTPYSGDTSGQVNKEPQRGQNTAHSEK